MQLQTIKLQGGYNPARFAFTNNEQLYNWYLINDIPYPTFYPSPGYQLLFEVMPSEESRGLVKSTLLDSCVAVIGNTFYKIDNDTFEPLGKILSESGNVDIVENESQTDGQIAINDGSSLYVYKTSTNQIESINPGFLIQDLTFQDGYFIGAEKTSNKFYISGENDATSWNPLDFTVIDSYIVAIRSFKEKLYVFGQNKTVIFYNTGNASFPFQKNILTSFVYGALSKDSVAIGENYMAWLGSNDKTSPVLVASDGGDPIPFSEDGIDNEIDNLTTPQTSEGFFYQIDNHVFYQINFTQDNLSLCYDFSSKIFTRLCDKNINLHPVKKIARFNNTYFSIIRTLGNIYEFSREIYTFDGEIVPRIVMSTDFEYQDNNFSIPRLQIYPEQGDNDKPVTLMLSVSRDRGRSFRLIEQKSFVTTALRRQLMHFLRLGAARFWAFKLEAYSTGRVVLRAQIDIRVQP